ncbi:MAG: T9SS type A sorting domain-containing protein [Bacteroidales bacterium]|nr:T9SS type A sorting domain-containing protein [Bacteroidales bacterium]
MVLSPDADFMALVTTVHEGDTVHFSDLTVNNPTDWEWEFEGGTPSTSSGIPDPEVIYTSEGTYDVSLTASNSAGSDEELKTDYITVLPPVSVDDRGDEMLVSIYPNPVKDQLFIDNKTGRPQLFVALFNEQGRFLFSGEINGKQGMLDCSVLEPGVYFVKLNNTEQKGVYKIVKQEN